MPENNNYPEFEIEGIKFPKLIMGTSPFMGADQFGSRAESYKSRFSDNPDNIAELLAYFVDKGCKGVHVCLMETIVRGVIKSYKLLGYRYPVLATIMPGEVLEQFIWMHEMETKVTFLHAMLSDMIAKKLFLEFIDKSRKAGYIPGISTHTTGITIPIIDRSGLDIQAYLAPINRTGKHVHPNLRAATEALRRTKKVTLAMKTLAAGELKPDTAFPFVWPLVKGVVVGLTEKEEIDQAYRVMEKIENAQKVQQP